MSCTARAAIDRLTPALHAALAHGHRFMRIGEIFELISEPPPDPDPGLPFNALFDNHDPHQDEARSGPAGAPA